MNKKIEEKMNKKIEKRISEHGTLWQLSGSLVEWTLNKWTDEVVPVGERTIMKTWHAAGILLAL